MSRCAYDAWMLTATQPLSRTERALLCEVFDEVGPDAPTMCQGWAARDLAAHLVARERRPDVAAAVVLPMIPALTRRLQAVQDELAARPWSELVDLVRSGPPAWSPLGLPIVERSANSAEYFVHHEDVRRARPGWAPRDLPAATQEDLWGILRGRARLFYRNAPAGVLLHRSDTGAGELTICARRDARSVTLTGQPQELLLYAMGRTSVARVELTGDADDLAAFSGTPLAI